ncbi:unnamed protein product [Vitrella brassicaformis CCMP3155]|uniref:Uncharacterized protein n=1 Tax=Vitrella brassicaformis (strain CCMP3155) TaxID=1169540 RepID=A0A0G4FXX7_VITBC|nr:unnamed protein product [Vitrella brassicaformis CCMP3155]|eukprot:CEM20287.1 unnamed protein product [Vitrella brassicaformis CCMP3155]
MHRTNRPLLSPLPSAVTVSFVVIESVHPRRASAPVMPPDEPSFSLRSDRCRHYILRIVLCCYAAACCFLSLPHLSPVRPSFECAPLPAHTMTPPPHPKRHHSTQEQAGNAQRRVGIVAYILYLVLPCLIGAY